MEHREFKRILPHADTALLLIHGIVGTPNHFSMLLPLIPEDISVWNLLLDGHGKGVREFAHTSMEKWEQQMDSVVTELLHSHKRVYVAAHSMGTLFAIEQALRHKEIAGLFLLAAPLEVFVKPSVCGNALKLCLDKIQPDDRVALAMKACGGVKLERNLLVYLTWTPRFWELLCKIREVRKKLPLLTTPCIALQSRQDELVSRHTVKYLEKSSAVSVIELENSGHFFYSESDLRLIRKMFREWLCQ